MPEDLNRELHAVPSGLDRSSVDLQTQLNRAYLSGNGAEVERVLGLIAASDMKLRPKSSRAA